MFRNPLSQKGQTKLPDMEEKLREEVRFAQSGIQVAPLRTLDDFALASSRFQLPEPNSNPVKRIVNNLVYYQTNYFLLASGWSLIAISYYKGQFVLALLIMALVHLLSLYARYSYPPFSGLQRQQPAFIGLATFLVGSYLASLFTSFGVIVTGFLVPIMVVLAHSLLRLRNMKNKLTNVTESLGFTKRTPMGLILEEFGIDQTIKLT